MKTKIKELIKPQTFDQNELESDLVTPFCSSGYSVSSSGVTCQSGYNRGFWSVTSTEDEDDVLI